MCDSSYHAAMFTPGDHSPLLGRAKDVADRVLYPAAQQVDQSPRVPQSHFVALATAGLFDLTGPSSEIRRTLATIAGGCGATFFVWAQHHGVVSTLQNSDNADLVERWLGPLRAGSTIAGVAFAHLRRTGTPAIRATPAPGGWNLSGVAPWATSWGIAECFAVAAVTDDGRAVWVLLPGVEQSPSYRATSLELAVLQATGTVAFHFDHHHVGHADVLRIDDLAQWQVADRSRAAQGQTGVLGVTERAIDELEGLGGSDELAAAAGQRLRARLDDLWRTDDAFGANLPECESAIAEASEHRAECLRLGHTATTAFLAASGGRGMDLSHPAQRLARETAFYVIQAQTGDGRSAVLRRAN